MAPIEVVNAIRKFKKQAETVTENPHKVYFTRTLANDFGLEEGDLISAEGQPPIEVAILEELPLA